MIFNKGQLMSDVPDRSYVRPPVSGSSIINVGPAERIASVLSGALLTAFGIRNFKRGGFALALSGGFMLYRGATGNCPVNTALGRSTSKQNGMEINIERAVTINKPRNEVFAFWRKLENLPRFMTHLEEIVELDSIRSHWSARIPGGLGTLEWDAEIIHEEENWRIVWQSVPGAVVDNAGEVVFRDAPGNRGTEVHAAIYYRPPAGAIGGALSKLLNPVFEQLVKKDMRQFKQFIETGEVATIEGQPSGRSKDKKKAETIKKATQKTQTEENLEFIKGIEI